MLKECNNNVLGKRLGMYWVCKKNVVGMHLESNIYITALTVHCLTLLHLQSLSFLALPVRFFCSDIYAYTSSDFAALLDTWNSKELWYVLGSLMKLHLHWVLFRLTCSLLWRFNVQTLFLSCIGIIKIPMTSQEFLGVPRSRQIS